MPCVERRNATYPFAQFLHLVGMACGDGTLVVTQNGNLAIGIVVRLDLLRNSTRGLHILEKVAHGEGSVVGTENLGSQTTHVVL